VPDYDKKINKALAKLEVPGESTSPIHVGESLGHGVEEKCDE